MTFNKFFGLCAIASGIVLAGCGGDKPTQTTETKPTENKTEAKADTPTSEQKIKVGVMSGPEHKVAEVAARVAKEKYGLVVEYVEFNDYALPNTAVSTGDLDANAMMKYGGKHHQE